MTLYVLAESLQALLEHICLAHIPHSHIPGKVIPITEAMRSRHNKHLGLVEQVKAEVCVDNGLASLLELNKGCGTRLRQCPVTSLRVLLDEGLDEAQIVSCELGVPLQQVGLDGG